MKGLDKNWLTEGLIDFEYKKYILLAYLNSVKTEFDALRLYPFLSDLLFHYQNIKSIRDNKQLFYENFPKEISKADFEKLEIVYKKIVMDDEIMRDIEDIINFSLPLMEERLKSGKELYQEIEGHLEISPVGISPLYPDEGYLMFYLGGKETRVYEYQITIFENPNENYRGIHTRFLETCKKGIGVTFESLKLDLIRRYKKLPNPATYLINSKISVPFDESLLPIAKRMLVKQIY